MTTVSCFDTLLLLARPAAGKSEIIDFLTKTPLDERIAKFHIGVLTVLDDFPMLWSWFEEDAILDQIGQPHLYTNPEGYFNSLYLWDVLIRRLCLDHRKWQRDTTASPECQTALIEFSRGVEHGGYSRAFQHISPEVAQNAAILYVDVSWEESLRKNRKRYNPDRPDSILEHALPDHRLEHLYKSVDWNEVTKTDPEYIQIQGFRVPYIIFENHDDVTSRNSAALSQRLESTLMRLWNLWRNR